MKPDRFNIRAYALILNEAEDSILISDEQVAGIQFSKFPGGGLEFGEGLLECVKREALEELDQEINSLEHFYTTDFFQLSAFNERDQLISIYYRAKLVGKPRFPLSKREFDFGEAIDGAQAFRWQKINKNLIDQLKWPVDKVVAEKLIRLKKN